jgi:hypothetical protein
VDDRLVDLWVGPEGSGPLGDGQVGQGWYAIRAVVGWRNV